MSHSRILHIVGAGLAFLISIGVYIKTVAPTVPFWDGGEFIASSYILGIPHPPGSPFYILIGRLFSLFPGMSVAWWVNFSSSLFSALAVTFVYLIIVKAISIGKDVSRQPLHESLAMSCGGLVGALMLAFSDTFWFNAVEAEVYSLAMLFMTVCAWLTLHWVEHHERQGSERYLLLIAYLVFLGIAVHMFTLLIAPAVFLCAVLTDSSIRSNKKIIALFAVIGLIISSVVTSIDAFMVSLPLTILGLVVFRGRVPWTYFLLPAVVGLLVMFFGSEGAGNFNDKAALNIGSFDVTVGTLMFVIMLVSVALALVSATAEDPTRYRWSFWAMLVGLAIAGYSVNFYVPVRAAQQPIINENDPSNWSNFEYFLERKQYGQESMLASMFNRKGSWSSQFGGGENIGFWRFFSRQFSNPAFPYWLFPVLLAGLGLITQMGRDKRSGVFLGLMFLICSVGLVLYMNFSDGTRGIQREVRERDYFFTPAFVFAAILIGIGLCAFLNTLKSYLDQSRLPGGSIVSGGAILALALPIVPLNYHYTTHTREGNYIPFDYGYNILQSCDKDAILFTNGDNDTFTLWYLQEVEGIRKDVRVVNLSLLNTDWYIKQLKNLEPRVPISFSETEIERLSVQLWQEKQMSLAGLTWSVPPSGQLADGRGYVRVQDRMILHILETNNWKRPMYFAVTVSPENKVGLTEYLTMEGMVFRIVTTRGANQMDLDRTHKNLWEVYQYRGIADSTVYKDEQTTNLLRNYTAAFQQLAVLRWQQGQIKEAIQEMEKYLTLRITNGSWEHTILTQFYADDQQYDNAAEYAEKLAAGYNTFDGYIIMSDAYRRKGMDTQSFDILEKGLASHPNYPKGFEQLAKLYFSKGDTGKVIATLERWLKIAPGDSLVKQSLADLRKSSGNMP